MRIRLHRIRQTDEGTLGQLVVGDLALCTVERPWLKNAKRVSCVPCGFYVLEEHDSQRFPNTWALVGADVSHYPEDGIPRSAILIHAANKPGELQGCIAPGMEFGSGVSVEQSQPAMTELRRRLGFDEPHYLTITRHTAGGE